MKLNIKHIIGVAAVATLGMVSCTDEIKFGNSFLEKAPGGTVTADFSVLYNWNVCNMDWTPSAGRWFFDAGAGINVGGKGHYAYVGVAGSAKLGIAFKGAPVRLSFDWSPAFGPGIAYWDGGSHSEFNERALCNFGITCVYCF